MVEPEETIEYYVKYEYKFSSYMGLAKVAHVEVRTEKNTQSFDIKPSSTFWEGVYGPFHDYTTLRIKARTDRSYPNLNMQARISISNGGPFVLKVEKDIRSQALELCYIVSEKDIK